MSPSAGKKLVCLLTVSMPLIEQKITDLSLIEMAKQVELDGLTHLTHRLWHW